MTPPGDVSRAVELPGPWEHRYVAANGARFHVAAATGAPATGPLVLLLHGFPEFWWAWRAQLPALAAAGYRAVAMDLRGYGGSDKTPRGYDPMTLARDVSGVVKALGERSAVVVGHGWGGYVGWAAALLHAREVAALAAVAAPHPAAMLDLVRHVRRVDAVRHVLAMLKRHVHLVEQIDAVLLFQILDETHRSIDRTSGSVLVFLIDGQNDEPVVFQLV